jgi:hypothetical protein
MTYNLSILTNTTGVPDLAYAANVFSGNVLFSFFSIGIFFVLLFILKRFDFDKALLASSFISFVLAAFLTYGGFLSIYFVVAYLAMAAFTALYIWVAVAD